MIYKIIFALSLSFIQLSAIEFAALNAQPRSLAKDFYIYRFLQEPTTTHAQAWELLGQADRLNRKLLFAFNDKIQEEGFNKVIGCMKLNKEDFLKADVDCQAIRISPSFALKLTAFEQQVIYERIKEVYPEEVQWMPALSAKKPFKALLSQSPEVFISTFNAVSTTYRHTHLNHNIPLKKLNALADHWSFKNLVNTALMDKALGKVARSLLFVDPSREKMHEQSAFFLGLIALRFEWFNKADRFFERAQKEAYYQMDKDKALFWRYLTTKKKKYLHTLSESFDLNLYSAYARELLKKKPYPVLSPKPTQESLPNYSISDPFTWGYTLKHIQDMNQTALDSFAETLFTKETLPHYAFLKEKASGYTKHFFIEPYSEHLSHLSPERKTLMLSIARQESRFIPASISTSYALGMMQFMPFLADAMSEQEALQGFDLEHMFEPRIAYYFADKHFDYLTKHLYHPLFIAYAYNGGIGFTRRLLERGDLFKKGRFEPFMSMELIPYAESRKYGKKVLANYVTYGRLYGLNTSFSALFQSLTKPSLTDRFR